MPPALPGDSLLFSIVLLYCVDPYDVVTFAGTVGLVVVMGLAATYLPARRASSVDPIESLRGE